MFCAAKLWMSVKLWRGAFWLVQNDATNRQTQVQQVIKPPASLGRKRMSRITHFRSSLWNKHVETCLTQHRCVKTIDRKRMSRITRLEAEVPYHTLHCCSCGTNMLKRVRRNTGALKSLDRKRKSRITHLQTSKHRCTNPEVIYITHFCHTPLASFLPPAPFSLSDSTPLSPQAIPPPLSP